MIRASIFVAIFTTILFASYEYFLRSKNYPISYDDDSALFSDKRRKVYLPQDKATVVIGSSRTKFDLSPDVWKEQTGETLLQLSNVGSNALYSLHELSKDEKFNGKLIIDASENMLFNASPRMSKRAKEMTEYYHSETPAQRFSFFVNQFLESQLLFLDKENFSFSALLDKSTFIPKRKGKQQFPPYPVNFGRMTKDRQEFIGEGMLKDSTQIKQMRKVWVGISTKTSAPNIQEKDSLIRSIKEDIERIVARGGKVIFVRPPSSGPLILNEKNNFPRKDYYEELLKITGCKGINFEDFPEMQNYNLPEYSHLTQVDARRYTKELIDVIQKGVGWNL